MILLVISKNVLSDCWYILLFQICAGCYYASWYITLLFHCILQTLKHQDIGVKIVVKQNLQNSISFKLLPYIMLVFSLKKKQATFCLYFVPINQPIVLSASTCYPSLIYSLLIYCVTSLLTVSLTVQPGAYFLRRKFHCTLWGMLWDQFT